MNRRVCAIYSNGVTTIICAKCGQQIKINGFPFDIGVSGVVVECSCCHIKYKAINPYTEIASAQTGDSYYTYTQITTTIDESITSELV